MAELQQELRALAAHVEFPATPELSTRVRARLAEEPVRVRRLPFQRRTAAIALAALALAAAGVLAVPQARTAILEWLGVRGVSIERVDELPAVQPQRADYGTLVSLEDAERLAGFRVLLPAYGRPDRVYYRAGVGRGMVTLLYGSPLRPRLLLTEVRARTTTEFAGKMVGPGTSVLSFTLDRRPAVWIEGQAHVVFYVDELGRRFDDSTFLAGNTLLWERGDLTLRLEADLSRAQAVAIARSLR